MEFEFNNVSERDMDMLFLSGDIQRRWSDYRQSDWN